ncbi:lysozyme [Paraburkholderia fungorum]|uniref:lysozyme n=1 Tax=Paraburkholderia fungorum TaxID=134537 RepID=UPI0038BCCFE6
MPTINKALLARISAGAVAAAVFIVGFEGASNKVYIDPVGHRAVCVGHDSTGPDGKPLRLGDTYTDDVCSYLLGKDIAEAQKALATRVKVPLSDGERLAYTDFIFNMGSGAFTRSSILRKLNKGDRKGACAALLLYVKGTVKGKLVTLPGLVTRRKAENKACLG